MPMSLNIRPVGVRAFLKSRLAIGALVCLSSLALLALWVGWGYERQRALVEAKSDLTLVADELATRTATRVQTRQQTMLFLASVPPIQGIINVSSAHKADEEERNTGVLWKSRLAQIFSGFLKSNPDAYQLRYIGVADGGKELVRVERRPDGIFVAPDEALQQKGERDYFKETIKLPQGEVYISDITLNREHGKVEVPHIPSARSATPVYDANGKVFGIVVINLDVRETLRRIRDIDFAGTVYIMNTDGDFLVHPEKDRTFGFDLGHPYRFEDEFSVEPSEEGTSPFAMRQYESKSGRSYGLIRQVEVGHSPQRVLQFAALKSESQILRATWSSLARSLALGALVGVAYMVLLFFYWESTQRRLEVRVERLRLATIVDHSSDAIIALDLRGRIQSWNHGARQLFGFGEEEARGKVLSTLLGFGEDGTLKSRDLSEDQPGRTVLRSVRRGGKAMEVQLHHKSGSQVEASATFSPVHNVEGLPVGTAVVIRDVGAQNEYRRRIELMNAELEQQVAERTAELASTSALQHAILARAGYAIVATDLTGTITLFNPAAERMLGYSAEELVGKATPAIFHEPSEIQRRARELTDQLGETVEPGFEVFVALVREIEADEHDWTYKSKDGSHRPVRLTVSALRTAEGESVGFLGIASDRTEILRREEALKKARQEAESSNRAKSEFLANTSHEIRTPMNAIMGMLQLLRATPLNAQQRDYARNAESATKTLLAILNDILDLSKIEAGKLTLNASEFSLDEMLGDLASVLAATVRNKDLDVLFDLEPEVPRRMIGDSLRLQQVLLNLTSNAIKFTEEGQVVVHVALKREEGEDIELAFRVSDTGVGLSLAQQARIFENFVQAEGTTTRRYGGTGLGLSISRQLVGLMGGALQVESTEGVGSHFTFVAHLKRTDDLTKRDQPSLELPELTSLRVLVADQNPVAGEIIARIAQSLGWKTELASDHSGLLSSLREAESRFTPFDLVLLDHRLLYEETDEEIPIPGSGRTTWVVITQGLQDSQVSLTGPFVGVLPKPLTGSTLFDAVASARGALLANRASIMPARSRLRGVRLLVVEDVPINQRIAQQLLESEGAMVAIAGGGLEALRRLGRARNHFDLVLMDVQMPDLDGMETTRRVRALGLNDLPIIAMTANAMDTDRQACLDAGMNDHIGKPFHLDKLVGRIRHFIDKADTSTRPTSPTNQPLAMPSVEKPLFQPDKALERLGGNSNLLTHELLTFCLTYGTLPLSLRGDLSSEQGRTQAIADLHAFRGLAGTLGAARLAALLLEWEQALKQGGDGPFPVQTAHEVLNETLVTIEDWLSTTSAEPIGPNVGRPDDRQRLEDLSELLQARNMRAIRLAASLYEDLRPKAPELVAKLETKMQSLEFQEAHELCQELKERHSS